MPSQIAHKNIIMGVKKYFYFLIFIVIGYGCNKSAKHFYSADKSKCITIITKGDIRYVINGYFDAVPDSNYVKISLDKIDRETGDQIVGCWNRENLQWIILMDKAVIIENKLDPKRFVFKENFPMKDFGIPTLENYHTGLPNCFSLSFEYRDVLSVEGDISN
ncbi:MAG: hypothetical protein EOO87_12840 [Pedobacter sp.]|nr:MAG: hypothetical protein EOO87_12840 [Pedobacter sp.]